MEEERGVTRKAFTYFFEVIKEIACKNTLMFKENAKCTTEEMPMQPPSNFLLQNHSESISFHHHPILLSFLCKDLGTGSKEDTEAVELAASGVLCLNHVLNFLCVYLPQHHLSSCPTCGTSCGMFNRSSTLQRLLRSITTCLCGLYCLEGCLMCDVGRRASKPARVRTAVQDALFKSSFFFFFLSHLFNTELLLSTAL